MTDPKALLGKALLGPAPCPVCRRRLDEHVYSQGEDPVLGYGAHQWPDGWEAGCVGGYNGTGDGERPSLIATLPDDVQGALSQVLGLPQLPATTPEGGPRGEG